MRRVLDVDPLTGLTTYFDYDRLTDSMILTYSQDVSKALKKAELLRNDESYTKEGFKDDMWHYAHVPVSIQYEMLYKHGVDFWKPEDAPKVFDLLNSEYQQFKTTTKMHRVK